MDCGDRNNLQLLQATGRKQSRLKLLLYNEDGLHSLGGTHSFFFKMQLSFRII